MSDPHRIPLLLSLDGLVWETIAPSLDVSDYQALMRTHRALQPAALLMKDMAAHASRFTYAHEWHATPSTCDDFGCTHRHIMVSDLIPELRGPDTTFVGFHHKERAVRSKLRRAVRQGSIIGTLATQAPVDLAVNPNLRRSSRRFWWWHDGDPELREVRRVLGLAS